VFTILGATGNVGGATARALIAADQPTRVVARDPSRIGSDLTGAEVVSADLIDRPALTSALKGSRGSFVLLPFDPLASGIAAQQARMIDTIRAAVTDAGVPHVAVVSSLGADSPDGPAILRLLHELETELRDSGAIVSTVRSTYFQEKVGEALDAARGGVYPVFGEDVDTPVPMVATSDVGAAIAAALLEPPPSHEIVDVLGPAYSERQLAEALGSAIGETLTVATVPRPAWEETLTAAGLSSEAAAMLAELYDAGHQGLLRPRGDRQIVGNTPIEATVERMVATSWIEASS
jgi:uncharacterized protein YbjT (DUF2867 family)